MPELTLEDLASPDRVAGVAEPQEKLEFPMLSTTGLDLTNLLESIEKNYLEEAFKMAKGNESAAARLLNLNHHTFRYRYKKLKAL